MTPRGRLRAFASSTWQVTAKADTLIAIPPGMEDDVAASFPMAYGTRTVR